MSDKRKLLPILIVVMLIISLISPCLGVYHFVSNSPVDGTINYNPALDTALNNRTLADGDIIVLYGAAGTIVNSTRGDSIVNNISSIRKDITIMPWVAGVILRLNNTIELNQSDGSTTLTIGTGAGQTIEFRTDSDTSLYNNMSLIQILRGGHTIQTGAGDTWLINLSSNPGIHDVINVTGNSSTINTLISVNATNANTPGTVFNITGSSNTLTLLANSVLNTTDQIGININGSSNTVTLQNVDIHCDNERGINITGDSNTINIDNMADIIAADNGKVFLEAGVDSNAITITNLPSYGYGRFYLYNSSTSPFPFQSDSVAKPVGYFYNGTQSLSGNNTFPIVNISGFPLTGWVNMSVQMTNMSFHIFPGLGGVMQDRTDPARMLEAGLGNVTFGSVSFAGNFPFKNASQVYWNCPAYVDLGTNSLNGDTTVDILNSVFVNFNALTDIADPGMNSTYTTNWTSIPNFRAVSNLTFSAKNATSQWIMANMSFLEVVNLTDQSFCQALGDLGTALTMNNTQVGLDITTNANMAKLNKRTSLQVYPGFEFNDQSNVVMASISDVGATTNIWDGTNWLNNADTFVIESSFVANNGMINISSLHFSSLKFSRVGAPIVNTAATDAPGLTIVITFSKAMASPVGKEGEFMYQINGGADQAFGAAAFGADTTQYSLTPAGTALANGQVITVSYTKGTVQSADGGILESFTGQAVTNNIAAGGGAAPQHQGDTGGGSGSTSGTGVGVVSNVKAGETADVVLRGSGTAVSDVEVKVNQDVSNIVISASKKTYLPSDVPSAGSPIYQYLDIKALKVNPSAIDGAAIDFSVPNSWLSQNGLEPQDVVMRHYNEETGTWEDLLTEVVSVQGGYTYYRAVTPGFSYFAISYEKDGSVIEETSSAPVVTPAVVSTSAPSTVAATPTTAPAVAPAEVPAAGLPMTYVIIAVIVIMIVAGIGIGIRKKRQEEYPDWWYQEEE